ncbi:PREDICTED: uncharacterized protein K02A2.6-like [Priapulus caudatus]|uniref:Uncharacterized protein K02A2.6-like n=1 Tax=Priapulus caudatus TaxID=37621 RepID=A0ABM1DWY8_PRICU|nr:PREDICTED: uncharacterized protein K02A2.6-like [Priapulus caudatus]
MTARDKPLFSGNIAGTPVRVIADSGASVNVLNETDYLAVKNKSKLTHSNSRVYPYYMSAEPLNLLGKFQADASNGQYTCKETFFVVNGPSSSLLSWKASQKFNLITSVISVSEPKSHLDTDIMSEFPTVTAGMGTCKCDPVKVVVDESIKPVAQPHRRISFHVRKKVEQKLDELERADIIERAEGPTPWISPIVAVPKLTGDEIRICVDMRAVNQAISRERHVIPTIDDIVADLNGCKVFSKVDLRQGYHK